ncbi:hypothetical protein FBZ85_11611 [Azospirillum brasilense]|nr:DUF5681 domain-containing protein [Azospirillum baldaniorum]TWA73321.1 hypothetical protein FBZ85_11611 [Azospirillum brasilense]
MTGDYKVGYKKPPPSHRFQPGKSGNPKGRPRKSKNLSALLAGILGETVTLREDGAMRTVSKGEAMLLAQTHKAIKGDTRAFEAILKLETKTASSSASEPTGVLVVPGPFTDEEWEKRVEQHQAKYRGNIDNEDDG